MKVLNLYAGIGGNRKLWTGVEVTAVEKDPKIAAIYKDFFPDDEVIVGDAHQYLLDHFKEFDFIWSSPPCPTHSVCNRFLHPQGIVRYPDMSLWQEIIFLREWFKGKFVVENVKSYYQPLYIPQELDRHYFWCNFTLRRFNSKRNFNAVEGAGKNRLTAKEEMIRLQKFHGLEIEHNKYFGIRQKTFLLRNCVEPELGLHILNEARADLHSDLFR